MDGDLITLRTPNPAELPLPYPPLLQTHTVFARILHLKASAGYTENEGNEGSSEWSVGAGVGGNGEEGGWVGVVRVTGGRRGVGELLEEEEVEGQEEDVEGGSEEEEGEEEEEEEANTCSKMQRDQQGKVMGDKGNAVLEGVIPL
ncbi:hypothetical protein DFP73DRAFT_598785 [Morchella snyderi]|nr:hypothetical protein DFP73DRAFT_598785 [Morchella snyderi]